MILSKVNPVAEKRVECPVSIPDTLRVGTYANAFRVLQDQEDFFLDFLAYSAVENQAVLVSRLRIKPEFLSAVMGRIGTVLVELNTLTKTSGNEVLVDLPDDAEIN